MAEAFTMTSLEEVHDDDDDDDDDDCPSISHCVPQPRMSLPPGATTARTAMLARLQLLLHIFDGSFETRRL